MILQVLTNSGTVKEDHDALFPENTKVADTRQLE